MDEPVVYELRTFQRVMTPNGPGIIQGRMVEKGETLIIVSHQPHDPEVSEEVKRDLLARVWIRRFYRLDQLRPISERQHTRRVLAVGRTR